MGWPMFFVHSIFIASTRCRGDLSGGHFKHFQLLLYRRVPLPTQSSTQFLEIKEDEFKFNFFCFQKEFVSISYSEW